MRAVDAGSHETALSSAGMRRPVEVASACCAEIMAAILRILHHKRRNPLQCRLAFARKRVRRLESSKRSTREGAAPPALPALDREIHRGADDAAGSQWNVEPSLVIQIDGWMVAEL